MKNEKDRRDGRFSIKRNFFWLQITTVAFFLCWLSFLTGRSFRPETSAVLGADLVHQLMANQEVRSIPALWEIEETFLAGSWKEAADQTRPGSWKEVFLS